ncbi:MAG: hypothetical protein GEU98_18540 [Pseudonocardiaceae bacterium]|nr:hypothetical protein [Pseudonocardiaceae bacterium]
MPEIQFAEQAGVGPHGATRPTEDRLVVLDNAVLLLDGATSLRPELPSGGWYAEQLAAELADRLTARPADDLADLLAAAIEAVRDRHGLRPGHAPSSTIAMLRWTDAQLDALVLADSPVVAFGPGGTRVLADNRLAELPRGSGGFRERLRSGAGFGAGHLAALTVGTSATAAWRNVDGGFWVAEAEPAAAYRAVRARWARSSVNTVLLATDGVSCAVDDYEMFSWPGLRELACAEGPQAVLDAIREAEVSDPDGRRWPRPKPHDDQAIVLITDW